MPSCSVIAAQPNVNTIDALVVACSTRLAAWNPQTGGNCLTDGKSQGVRNHNSVLRAALPTSAIDGVSDFRADPSDPHRIFLADADGRLITRLSPEDRLEPVNEELRIAPRWIPKAIMLALRGPLLDEKQGVERTGELTVDGERWLATFRALAGSQDWFVGIVVPEAAYTRGLHALRWRLLIGCAVIIGLVLLGGAAALLALRSGIGRIRKAAARMPNLEGMSST